MYVFYVSLRFFELLHTFSRTVPSVSCFTDLEVSYDGKLRFKPHIDQMVAKASLRAKLILKCFQSRDHGTKAFCLCKTHIRVC